MEPVPFGEFPLPNRPRLSVRDAPFVPPFACLLDTNCRFLTALRLCFGLVRRYASRHHPQVNRLSPQSRGPSEWTAAGMLTEMESNARSSDANARGPSCARG